MVWFRMTGKENGTAYSCVFMGTGTGCVDPGGGFTPGATRVVPSDGASMGESRVYRAVAERRGKYATSAWSTPAAAASISCCFAFTSKLVASARVATT